MAQSLEHFRRIILEAEDLDCLLAPEAIAPESHLKNDLGFDSIALMSIVYELQEIYEDLDESHMADWKTVQDVLDECK